MVPAPLLCSRDDCDPMCLSGHLPGRSPGEETQPVCPRGHSDGHARQPGVHRLLRLLPLPGLRHGPCGWGYCSLWKLVSLRKVTHTPTQTHTHTPAPPSPACPGIPRPSLQGQLMEPASSLVTLTRKLMMPLHLPSSVEGYM